MLNLGTLGTGTTSVGQAINDSDVVVGYSSIDGCCGYHAFIWEAGVMYDLNSLIPADSGIVLENAFAINNRGEIAVQTVGKVS